MRIVISVLGLLALMSMPVQAAWRVTLTTGEVLTIESYWRDGDKTHLVRGGVDMIVATDRIASMEDGVAEPETGVQSATARRDGAEVAPNVADPVPSGDGVVESMKAYHERLGEMNDEELKVEEERITNALLEAQAARFHARHGGTASKEDLAAAEKKFRDMQRQEWAAETTLKQRMAQP